MKQTEENLELLSRKLQLLLQAFDKLKKENERLKSEHTQLQEQLEQQRKQAQALANQAKVNMLAGALPQADQPQAAELKELLNRHIRHIDECIRLMEI